MTAEKRVLKISPYLPARVESLGDATGQFAQADIGKAVKYNGDQMDLCADTNEIVGFVQSVEAYTKNGHSIGAVVMDSNGEAYATDEAGTLAIGDLVISGTPAALGTAAPSTGPNVKVHATPADAIHRWQVVAIYGTGAAGDGVLLRKL